MLTGWDQENFGFMHLGFQEYLAAREIRSRFLQEMNEKGRSELLKTLADHFGESWWQEVTLLLLALEDPPLFVPYMREVVRQPGFSKHGDLLEMCLDDAVKPSSLPFVELIETRTSEDEDLWKRQFLASKIVERLEGKIPESIIDFLKGHPYDKIRQWIQERFKEILQDVIRPEPLGYELVFVKGGKFLMGSNEDDSAKPVHEVTAPDFYMGRYPVTNEEYGRFLTETGYEEPGYWGERKFNQPAQPVVGVSWHDAQKFTEWANLKLPSEAQWEYACRAGTTTRFHWGDEPDCAQANYGNSNFSDECNGTNPGKPTPVGNYPPNAWGLYDMHGNVWEWCEDQYHGDYKNAPKNGNPWVDQEEGAPRVIRGGSWSNNARYCRSAYRGRGRPGDRNGNLGFRLVLRPGQQG